MKTQFSWHLVIVETSPGEDDTFADAEEDQIVQAQLFAEAPAPSYSEWYRSMLKGSDGRTLYANPT